jgi:glucosamine--fructose-6-phosphate aminotransferase (isomerizing)
MTLKTEIFEQPSILENLLKNQAESVKKAARAIKDKNVQYIFLAARGTSDNAGRYSQYLLGAHNGLPVALATPSLFTYYKQPPTLKGAMVVGISQSGQSPDIVSVLAEGRRQGCPTLAITNTPDSPMGEVSDFIIDIQAGVEKAVAATKTYSASLMAIAMLSAALEPDGDSQKQLANVPGWISQILTQDAEIERIAQRYRFMELCVVLGRGYNYATAYELSLKLKELTYTSAEAYSSADFQHGPIALIEQGFPVLAVAPGGKVFDTLMQLLSILRTERKADLMVISDQVKALSLAQCPIRLPAGIPEWISPIISIVPGQLFANYLTSAKGFDPEAPRGLHKVTETK